MLTSEVQMRHLLSNWHKCNCFCLLHPIALNSCDRCFFKNVTHGREKDSHGTLGHIISKTAINSHQPLFYI